MKAFLLWWTADHIQAVKKLVVLVAGLLGYLLPPGLWQQIAVIVATGGLTDSTFGSIWKLLQDNAAKDSGQLAQKLGSSNALKALLVVAALGLAAAPAPARADGWHYSLGPSVGFFEYDWGKATPVQVLASAGVQLSVSHDALRVDLFGKSWDALSAAAIALGSLVSPTGAQQWGQASGVLALCGMSSTVCGGIGKHILGPESQLVGGGWFWTLTLNANIAIGETPAGLGEGARGLLRGNTLYL